MSSRKLTDFGAVPDGGIGGGTIESGSDVVTLTDVPKVAVGQTIRINGARSDMGPLVTKVTGGPGSSGLSAKQIRVADAATRMAMGTGVEWGTNVRDALIKAADAFVTDGLTSLEIPPGIFFWDGPVEAGLGAGPAPSNITIWGHSGSSQLLLGGPTTRMTFYRANSVLIEDLTIRGLPSNFSNEDCDSVFTFGNRRATFRNVWWYGVAAKNAIIDTTRCDLTLDGGGLLGCVASKLDTIKMDLWAGLTIRDTEFLDHGEIDDYKHMKSSQNPNYTSRSWIGIFNPQHDLSIPNGGVDGARAIKITGARFDEGVIHHVLVHPGASNSNTSEAIRRITSVDIDGTIGLVLAQSVASGIKVRGVDHLTLRHIQGTAFPDPKGTEQYTLIDIDDVRNAKIECPSAGYRAQKILVGSRVRSLFLDEPNDKAQLVVDPAVRVRERRAGIEQTYGEGTVGGDTTPEPTPTPTPPPEPTPEPTPTPTPTGCPAPTNLKLTDDGGGRIAYTFDHPGASSYNFYVNTIAWSVGLIEKTGKLFGLVAGQTYTVYARAKCADGTLSADSAHIRVTLA